MARCFVGLGANQGQPHETFERVRQSLASVSGISICSASSNYRSRAMGVGAGADFLNAVVELQTACSPAEMLAHLQTLETELGRQREARWGPRIIDLDLLYCDDLIFESESLILPHPHAWYRRFVLEPMCEIAADFLHPAYSLTQQQLLQRIDQIPFHLELIGNAPTGANLDRLQIDFPELQIDYVSTPGGKASLVVSQHAKIGTTVIPVLNLDLLPVKNAADALQNVLEACLGHCQRVE